MWQIYKKTVDNVNQQAWHDDRGKQQLSVAEETGELFLDDGPSVAFHHSSPPFFSL